MKRNIINSRKKENGQIIVLLAVSLVVVIVVAALAVDGGMIYTERRFAQNAADAASMAGGGAILNMDIYTEDFSCPSSSTDISDQNKFIKKAYDKAVESAQMNNIVDLPFLGYYVNYKEGDSPIGGELKTNPNFNPNHGVMVKCYTDPYMKVDVEVRITSQLSTAFAHLIYPGDLATTNVAVTTMSPGKEPDPGMAIITTAKECDKKNEVKCGIYFSSEAAELKVTKSGIFTSNCLILSQSKTESQFNIEGDINLVCDKSEFLSDSWPGTESSSTEWLFTKLNFESDPETAASIDPPDPKDECEALLKNTPPTIEINAAGGPDFSKGIYTGIDVKNNETINLGEGLYCITGDIKMVGGTVNGDSVTIYQYPDTNFQINGGNINLTAPEDGDYAGLLFYLEGEAVNNGDPLLNGNASTVMTGMFYAPDRWVSISGTQDMGSTIGMQFVVKHFEITGQGLVNIVYHPNPSSVRYPQLYLQR